MDKKNANKFKAVAKKRNSKIYYENKNFTRCSVENLTDRRGSGPAFRWCLTQIYTAP